MSILAAYLSLHLRRILLYTIRDHFRQSQQILDPGDRPASRLLHKRIFRPDIGPRGRKIGDHALGVEIVHLQSTPPPLAFRQLKAPSSPRMKRMDDREELLPFSSRKRCSSAFMPTSSSNASGAP